MVFFWLYSHPSLGVTIIVLSGSIIFCGTVYIRYLFRNFNVFSVHFVVTMPHANILAIQTALLGSLLYITREIKEVSLLLCYNLSPLGVISTLHDSITCVAVLNYVSGHPACFLKLAVCDGLFFSLDCLPCIILTVFLSFFNGFQPFALENYSLMCDGVAPHFLFHYIFISI